MSQKVIALKINLNKCGTFLRKLAPYLHNPSIIPFESAKNIRLLLLNPQIIDSKDLKNLPAEVISWINSEKNVEIIDHMMEIEKPGIKKSKTLIIESDPIAEVLPKDIDSNIRKETLKHIMILRLEKEQIAYAKDIAKVLIEVSIYIYIDIYMGGGDYI